MISTKDNFSSKNIRILCIDFETRQITEEGNDVTRNQIFAAGFWSNTGFTEAIHLEDREFNNNEVKFIRYIVYKIQNFRGIITGWYLANSDLVILDVSGIGVGSPVGFYEVPVIRLEHGNEQDDDDNESLGNDIEDMTVKS